MTDATLSRSAPSPLVAAARGVTAALERIPYSLVALVARLSIAGVFWRSGQTKVSGFGLSDSVVDLFRDEYRLPLVDPALAATAAAIAEHLFPALLVLGLATRLSALALLIMTLVIQLLVYPDAWPTHGTWAACLLILMTRGAGTVSLDHLLARRFGTTAPA
ncbi:DoxX family protein [Rhodoplanes elegans]|uniref:DoxX family protein n=1 Tax=Rhodoplanes elegans TaxID=29408 RepID=A0A327K3A1_9BRAD|nr:DoxX family protein [Rhodoplanes elegans]MBK5960364.1 DoxX family protein [Rhodoplanes elegans]RAI32286.1 DoxX family protein [Rhodoplanes elegans]